MIKIESTCKDCGCLIFIECEREDKLFEGKIECSSCNRYDICDDSTAYCSYCADEAYENERKATDYSLGPRYEPTKEEEIVELKEELKRIRKRLKELKGE